MKRLYRYDPPDDLVLKAAQSVGLFSLTDSKWFDETFWNAALSDEVLGGLQDVYYPCFYREYCTRDGMSFSRYMTCVRQLLRSKHIRLERKDKLIPLGDQTYRIIPKYRISLESLPVAATVEVSF